MEPASDPTDPSDPTAPATPRHWLVSLARSSAFVPMTRAILGRLGYAIVPLEEWLAKASLQAHPPELCLVEERLIGELPGDREFETSRLVALTGREGVTSTDPRIIAGIQVPAGLHELYRVMQQTFEPTPRSAIRVPTQLPARLELAGRERAVELRSISENGCLVRSEEPLPLGTRVEIQFQLPHLGAVRTAAAPTYQMLPDTGLVFERTTPGHRRSIQIYVEQSLWA